MDEKEATKKAKALKKKLKGKGWRIHVWENCGNWYYELLNEGLQLDEGGFDPPHYTTLMSLDGVGGLGEWFVYKAKHYRDPNQAVKAQLRVANTDTVKRVEMIRKITKNLAG